MRRVWIGLISVAVIAAFMVAGCGGSSSETTKTTGAPAASATTAGTPATQALPTETTAAPAPGDDGWATVATLRSTDPAWQGMEGILISEPFSVSGEARLVLDMLETEEPDGVIVAIVSSDRATDPLTLIDAVRDGVVVTILAMDPVKEVSGLDGTYVLVNSVPATSAWSLELQSRP
jgi:hypothetical protein